MGAEVVQLFVQSNRQWRMPERGAGLFEAYRAAMDASDVVSATVCHAPYLINVISTDATTRARSFGSLVANLRAATALGAFALVLHPGSHRGTDAGTATLRIAKTVVAALEEAVNLAGTTCDLLFENTAGSGGTVGRSLAELRALIDATGGDRRVGVCLDTQHLWASGTSFATIAEADALVAGIADAIGLERLRCLHLNDSKVPLGAQRDRHENLGEGAIGPGPFRALLGHPALQDLPAVLETPGAGNGPRKEDLVRARELLEAGLAARGRGASPAPR